MSNHLSKKYVEDALGWRVEQMPVQLPDGTVIESHIANTRLVDDERQVLGVVGKNYQLIQNSDLLDLARSLCRKERLKFTNVGVIGDGERIYFQCSGQSYSVGNNDEITPYMLFLNAHDGSLACRMSPMTERLVCENQLPNFIETEASFVSIRHAGDVKQKLEEAGRLSRHFMTVTAANRKAMLALRKKQVTAKKMADFFRDMYLEQIREVTTVPDTRTEDLARNRADVAFHQYKERFEKETPIAGTTAWNMANAYTGWLQHDYRVGKDPKKSQQRRRHSSLFGILAQRSVWAFQAALNL